MADYEQSDATPGPLLWFGLATVLLVLLSALAMGWLHARWRSASGPLPPIAAEQSTDPEPVELHQYRWVDRTRGLVQIPIEEAMRATSIAADSVLDKPGGGRAGPPLRATSGGAVTPGELDR